jgi:hypothetical protein
MANSFTATYATKSFCTYIVFFAMLIYTKFIASVDLPDMRIEIEGWVSWPCCRTKKHISNLLRDIEPSAQQMARRWHLIAHATGIFDAGAYYLDALILRLPDTD